MDSIPRHIDPIVFTGSGKTPDEAAQAAIMSLGKLVADHQIPDLASLSWHVTSYYVPGLKPSDSRHVHTITLLVDTTPNMASHLAQIVAALASRPGQAMIAPAFDIKEPDGYASWTPSAQVQWQANRREIIAGLSRQHLSGPNWHAGPSIDQLMARFQADEAADAARLKEVDAEGWAYLQSRAAKHQANMDRADAVISEADRLLGNLPDDRPITPGPARLGNLSSEESTARRLASVKGNGMGSLELADEMAGIKAEAAAQRMPLSPRSRAYRIADCFFTPSDRQHLPLVDLISIALNELIDDVALGGGLILPAVGAHVSPIHRTAAEAFINTLNEMTAKYGDVLVSWHVDRAARPEGDPDSMVCHGYVEGDSLAEPDDPPTPFDSGEAARAEEWIDGPASDDYDDGSYPTCDDPGFVPIDPES